MNTIPKKRPKDCDPATWRLYRAVMEYVEKHGGSVLVVGGIQVQHWPEDAPMCYRIAVKCTGREPKFKETEVQANG